MNQAKRPIRFYWKMAINKYAEPNITYKGLLLTLECYMDKNGENCFPSYDEIQKVTGCSRKTISKYLKKAKKEEWIKVRLKGDDGQSWKHNDYKAWFPDRVIQLLHKEHGIIVENNTEKIGQLNLIARIDTKGSSRRKPPQEKAVSLRAEGSFPEGMKAVSVGNSIYPINSSLTKREFFSKEKKNVDNFSKTVNYNPRGFPIT